MPWVSTPDERVAHRLEGSCWCGADRSAAADVGIERSHQVHDLPEIRIKVSQHEVYRVRWGCGVEHVGSLGPEVSAAPCSYGPNIKTLAVYLLIYQHVPVHRCLAVDRRSLLWSRDFGRLCARHARPVRNRGARGRRADQDTITTASVSSASMRPHCAPVRPGPRNACCRPRVRMPPSLTVVAATWTPSLRSASCLSSRAWGVRDRYRNYFHPRWERLAGHQICSSHLLRDFADAEESYPEPHWPPQAQRALRGLIHAWHTARDNGQATIGEDVRDPLLREFRHTIQVGLAQASRVPGPPHHTAQNPGRDLLEFCRGREDDVLCFCFDTRLAHEHISERDLRPTKT